ncbi:uncharacterized protein isoform X2 [Rhodnius prolixus]|uniref:uncharacterized protein isoform X2 n=1 Tax=Rhodnius prolixus TaxID=13249 RepID=UPI003D18AA2C
MMDQRRRYICRSSELHPKEKKRRLNLPIVACLLHASERGIVIFGPRRMEDGFMIRTNQQVRSERTSDELRWLRDVKAISLRG